VSVGGEADLDAERFVVVPEQATSELALGDYAVRHTKVAHQPTDELNCPPGRNRAHRLHLNPPGRDSPLALEGMDPRCPTPNSKEPGERDGLQLLRWLMDFLGVELACLTPLDHLSSI
jgi:hypothetical protein